MNNKYNMNNHHNTDVTPPPLLERGGRGVRLLLSSQLSSWDTARNNYDALAQVKVKEMEINGCLYKVQFNPARLVSSAAKVDTKSIRERKCFLCPDNLPPVQKGIPFGTDYQILVNPFPIFPEHLTIPTLRHTDQRIAQRFGDMLDLAEYVEDYVVFYNGPKCGASAPDHVHFQAGNKGFLPIEKEWKEKKAEKVAACEGAVLWALDDYPRATLLMEATKKEAAGALFDTIYESLTPGPSRRERGEKILPEKASIPQEEPMMNILCWKENDRWIVCIFPRARHRPSCYTAEGDANLLISPASVDMGGVFITPLEKDFDKITASDIADILAEVCLGGAAFRTLIERIKERL